MFRSSPRNWKASLPKTMVSIWAFSVLLPLGSSDDETCRIWDARSSQCPPRIFMPKPSDPITDGHLHEKERLKRCLRNALAKNRMVAFLLVDNPQNSVTNNT